MRKILSVLMVLLVSLSVFSTSVLAKEGKGKESLVSLGDSIPFGYNLENNNSHPSKEAYPYIIGEKTDLRVRNLGVPGWQTDDLLTALESDQKYRQAVRHADYITLSIGSNDLMDRFNDADVQALIADGSSDALQQVQKIMSLATAKMLKGMQEIINEINCISDAPIIVYNIYNPYPPSSGFYGLSYMLLEGINPKISLLSNINIDVVVVDAFGAFNGQDYLLPEDIHPTIAGQELLAEIGYEAIETLR
jgi:lysophospholipase L1-like esterase